MRVPVPVSLPVSVNVHVHVLVQRGFVWLLTSVPKLVLGVEEGVGETFAGEGGNLPQGGEERGGICVADSLATIFSPSNLAQLLPSPF